MIEEVVIVLHHLDFTSYLDIDRFFETSPGIIICNNTLATQLARPQVYIEQDERIAQAAETGDWRDKEEKVD